KRELLIMLRRMTLSRLAVFALLVLSAVPAFAQGNPTGAVQGKITDPDGLPVPGVTVTVSSPVLQGVRTTVSSTNGDYIIPFLPPGACTIKFELQGFKTATRENLAIVIAETLQVDIRMAVASVEETVQVIAAAPTEIAPNLTVATTYKSDALERLPVG